MLEIKRIKLTIYEQLRKTGLDNRKLNQLANMHADIFQRIN